MKKVAVLFISVIMFLSGMILFLEKSYASDYQGEENRGSIFQIIGDFITGNYKVDGKPLKEKGIIQSIADETKKMKLSSVDEPKEKSK